ncbi:Microtubule-associated serine/threonine-protein kinase 3 [Oopsacas minuta]|uniref:Microtubule-associated serine/threonine-protein kinase 3 n=1 Tax=Oopsacas minuta TaxID=111878 RepID=A0AAV7K8L3_9METZ|nr:Microtubule-associated serine/threonine-protein kinase 3 [Oopsacas minuta]
MAFLSSELRSSIRDDNLHDIIPILERLYSSKHPPKKQFLNWGRSDVMMAFSDKVNPLTIERIVSFLDKYHRESLFNSSLGTDPEDSDLLMDSPKIKMKDPDSALGISLATSLPANLFRNYYQCASTADLTTNLDRPSQPMAHGQSSYSISPSCSQVFGFQSISPNNIPKRSNIKKYRRKLCSSTPDLLQLQRMDEAELSLTPRASNYSLRPSSVYRPQGHSHSFSQRNPNPTNSLAICPFQFNNSRYTDQFRRWSATSSGYNTASPASVSTSSSYEKLNYTSTNHQEYEPTSTRHWRTDSMGSEDDFHFKYRSLRSLSPDSSIGYQPLDQTTIWDTFKANFPHAQQQMQDQLHEYIKNVNSDDKIETFSKNQLVELALNIIEASDTNQLTSTFFFAISKDLADILHRIVAKYCTGNETSPVISVIKQLYCIVSRPARLLECMGAGIYLLLVNDRDVLVEIENSTFINCSAVKGGGIFAKALSNRSQYVVNVRNSNFLNNRANALENNGIFAVFGGAIAFLAMDPDNIEIRIENTNFTGNYAYRGQGGAILMHFYDKSDTVNSSLLLTINNSIFLKNSAHTGGAIYFQGRDIHYPNNIHKFNRLLIDSSHFQTNFAVFAGAVFVSGNRIYLNSNNTFRNNSASNNGGVFLLTQAQLILNGSNLMERNQAGIFGGAIYLKYSKIILSRYNQSSFIRSNLAQVRGGGVYVENNLLLPVHMFDYTSHSQCFIQPDSNSSSNAKYSIIFSNNSVSLLKSHPNICLGNDIYVKTMEYCSEFIDDSFSLNATVHLFKSLGIHLNSSVNCSITTDVSRIHFDLEPMCKISGTDLNFNCSTNFDQTAFQDYVHRIKKFIRNTSLNDTTINLVFPGYISTFVIHLEDEFNQSTTFCVDVSLSPSIAENNLPVSHIEIFPTPTCWQPLNSYKVLFTHRDVEYNNEIVDMCVSTSSIPPLFSCTKLLVAKCPSGFKFQSGMCYPDGDNKYLNKLFENKVYTDISYNNGSSIPDVAKVKIPQDFPVIIYTTNGTHDKFVLGECKYFKCRNLNMQVNLLNPYHQCKDKLTGPYCTQCSDSTPQARKLLIPPVSILRIFTNNDPCYTCRFPWIWIPLYLIITVAITVIVLSLRIDIFNDYTRSIAFYSSILYLYVVSCGPMTDGHLFDLIGFILSLSNLLVSQNLPFCMSQNENEIDNVTSFDNLNPFVYGIYLTVVYLLFHKIPYLHRYNLGRDILFPMWTLFILTYSNLCVGVFVPFQCNMQHKWIYHGEKLCRNDNFFSYSAFIVATIIVPIPVMLIFYSYQSREKRIHLTENYEKRFRSGFKLWEVMKLFSRFFIAFIFPLPYIMPGLVRILPFDSCIVVSLICLLLLVINSLCQPATNHLANHFESFCLFILSTLGIFNISHGTVWGHTTPALFVLSPFVLFGIIKLYEPILKTIRRISTFLKEKNRRR